MNPKAREIIEHALIQIQLPLEPFRHLKPEERLEGILREALRSYGEAMVGELRKDNRSVKYAFSDENGDVVRGYVQGRNKAQKENIETLTRFNAW